MINGVAFNAVWSGVVDCAEGSISRVHLGVAEASVPPTLVFFRYQDGVLSALAASGHNRKIKSILIGVHLEGTLWY